MQRFHLEQLVLMHLTALERNFESITNGLSNDWQFIHIREYYTVVKKNKESIRGFKKIFKTDWENKARRGTVSNLCYLFAQKTFRKDIYRGISGCLYVTE